MILSHSLKSFGSCRVLTLDCDALFLGFGPITRALATRLAAEGNSVIVVTKQSTIGIAGTDSSVSLIETFDWSRVIGSHIRSKSTYIGWRESPKNQKLGVELISWINSSKFETEKIHHLSSASVYSGPQQLFSESDYDFRKSKSDLNSKQELEGLVLDVSLGKQSKFVNYRISNVYGLGLIQGFVNESINFLKHNQPLRIFRQVDLIRDYLLLDDLVNALHRLRATEFSDQVLNISTGKGVAISEIIESLELLTAQEVKFMEVEAPKEVVTRSVLSPKKLEEIISWQPQLLDESLKQLLHEEG